MEASASPGFRELLPPDVSPLDSSKLCDVRASRDGLALDDSFVACAGYVAGLSLGQENDRAIYGSVADGDDLSIAHHPSRGRGVGFRHDGIALRCNVSG